MTQTIMQQTLSSLLALQEIDRDIFRVRQELKRLPVERDRRQSILDRKQGEIDELKAQIHEQKSRVKEYEEIANESRARIKKIQGAAANSRADASLHANFEHEIRSLKKSISRGEDEALAYIERIEKMESDKAHKESVLEEEQKVFVEFSGNVDTELADATSRFEALSAQREARVKGDIKAETLELYLRLIEARDGDAMARLDGRVCEGCYMEVPANFYVKLVRGTEIMQCPSCDRILYS